MKMKFSEILVLGLVVYFAFALSVLIFGSWETPLGRAYRICEDSYIDAGEVQKLVEIARRSPLSRSEHLRQAREKFDDSVGAAREACVEAVLDVAELKR